MGAPEGFAEYHVEELVVQAAQEIERSFDVDSRKSIVPLFESFITFDEFEEHDISYYIDE